MREKTRHGFKWYEFEILMDFEEIVHGVFTKDHALSHVDLCQTQESLNQQKDQIHQKVLEDVLKLFDLKGIAFGKMFHDTKVVEIKKVSKPFEVLKQSSDGIFSKLPNIGLGVLHADCQAALFYDPKKKIIGNVHSGWRGSVKNIYENAIGEMVKKGSSPKDILACISPSLGPNFAEFINYKEEIPEIYYPFQVKPKYFDFWEISYKQLCDLGLLQKNIEIAKICTYESERDFFSYRRDKTALRNLSVIGYKSAS